MSYTYESAATGSTLRLSRCDDGHVMLVIPANQFVGDRVVCIADADVSEVTREIRAWARPASDGTPGSAYKAVQQVRREVDALQAELDSLRSYEAGLDEECRQISERALREEQEANAR